MVFAEQTIEDQTIKFNFYGEMEGHICGLLIYPTLVSIVHDSMLFGASKDTKFECLSELCKGTANLQV